MTGLRSANLYSEHSQVPFVPYRVVLKDKRPPAMHRVMICCKLGVLIKWLNWTHTGFKALRAGRTSNVQRFTLNNDVTPLQNFGIFFR
jgi:hypothetical protein